MQIGIISDTHSKIRPEAPAALAGSDPILHAGDVGRDEVLDALEAVAPPRCPMFKTWPSWATGFTCSTMSKPWPRFQLVVV